MFVSPTIKSDFTQRGEFRQQERGQDFSLWTPRTADNCVRQSLECGGSLQHESSGKGGRSENGAGSEEVVGGSSDDWAGGGVGVWSNLLKNWSLVSSGLR